MGRRFRYRFRVKFDNVDYARVLYFPRQIDFLVQALEEFCACELGISYRRMLDVERVSWPTVHIDVDYVMPLHYEDEAEVSMCVSAIGEKSVTFQYEVSRLRDGAVSSRARHVVAIVDMRTGSSIPVPSSLRERLEPWLSDDGESNTASVVDASDSFTAPKD